MSEQAAQEPTMEEILASIRRIISEDDAPAEGQAAAAAPEPSPAPEPVVEPGPVAESPALMDETPSVQASLDEEVLELTEKVEEPAVSESIGDLDIAPRFEPTPEPVAAVRQEEPAPFIAPTPQYQSSVTAAASGSLDEMVRTIIEAEIKAWLAQNLDQVMRDITKEKFDRVFK